jgi:hypothetical protein
MVKRVIDFQRLILIKNSAKSYLETFNIRCISSVDIGLVSKDKKINLKGSFWFS